LLLVYWNEKFDEFTESKTDDIINPETELYEDIADPKIKELENENKRLLAELKKYQTIEEENKKLLASIEKMKAIFA
jgi:hypothetical protein